MKKGILCLIFTVVISGCIPISMGLVRLDVPLEKSYKQGEIFEAIISVTNMGLSPLLLDAFQVKDLENTRVEFTHLDKEDRVGEIVYNEEGDQFVHTRSGQKEAFLPNGFTFHTGLIFPGDTKTFPIKMQILHAGSYEGQGSISYTRLSYEELTKNLYISTDKEIYQKTKREVLEDYKEAPEELDLVILKSSDIEMEEFSVKLKTEIKQRDFTLEQAVQLSGIVGEYWFAPKRRAWVLQSDQGVHLVTKQVSTLLPGINLFTFKGIEDGLPLAIYDENTSELASILSGLEQSQKEEYPWGVNTFILKQEEVDTLVHDLYEKGYTLKIGEHFLHPALIIQAIEQDELPGE